MKKLLFLAVAVLVSVSFLPVRRSDNPTFANPLFQQLWSEQTAAAGSLDLWGSQPLLWRAEPYADAPDGRRVVQYFDRGRMELTPSPTDGTEVTQGLLALELTTGQIRLGSRLLQYQDPPSVAIDSGAADGRVATYAGLSTVVQKPADDQSARHAAVDDWIDAAGTVTHAKPPVPVRAAQFVAGFDHNLPDVFARYFAGQPFGSMSWVQALGNPISEPFWTYYRRDGQALPSLIQVFERRILVYTPSLSPDQQFTLANVGRHYYRWRYGQDAPRQLPTPLAGDTTSLLSETVPNGFEVGVYAQHLGTPVGLAIGPSGDLWIATEQGEILRVRTTTGGGAAGKTEIFAEDLPNPRGLAVHEDAIYVTVDDGVMRLRDTNGDGRADESSYVTKSVEPSAGVQGAPAVSQAGVVYFIGRMLSDLSNRVVVAASPDGVTAAATRLLSKPGPLLVKGEQLFAIDQRASGNALLYQMALNADGSAAPPSSPLAQFPLGLTVNDVLVVDGQLWPNVPDGTILAAISDGHQGKIVILTPKADGSLPDVVDFSTGYGQPVDMAIGLDGALYVADAANQQVLKIVANKPAGP